MNTVTIFFDTSDPTSSGYSGQRDLPGRPGVAAEPAVSLTPARKGAMGDLPPRKAVAALRVGLNLKRVPISWERRADDWGWTGTLKEGV